MFDDVAVLGSANPSANGLALQDAETSSWHEVCALTRDREEIDRLIEWFDKLYASNETKRVTNGRLTVAEELWNRRRRATADLIKSSPTSLKQLAHGRNGSIVKDSTWIWIYDRSDVSEESKAYNSDLRATHSELADPYEVPNDPSKYGYDRVVDCFYERGRGGAIYTYPEQYRIYPEIAKRLTNGPSKGYWTLPASKIDASRRSKLLSGDTVRWLRKMVKRKVEGRREWDGTLGDLIAETEEN